MEGQVLGTLGLQLRRQALRRGLVCKAVALIASRHASGASRLRPSNVGLQTLSASQSGTCRPLILRSVVQRSYSNPSEPSARTYSFEEIRSLASQPHPRRLIIDVREPAELRETGRVPGAANMPISSNPDAFYLSNDDFYDRFGFEKPRARSEVRGHGAEDMATQQQKSPYTSEMKQNEAAAGINAEETAGAETGEVEEVIFYCKAGVRSRTAAKMAGEWVGLKIGDMTGGWNEWHAKGGPVERD